MKTYKGKKVRLDKFEWERSKGNDPKVKKFFLYEGYASIDDGEPHGIGKMTEIDDTTDKDRFLENDNPIRDGEWENGEFVKGTYYTPFIKKYVGSFSSSILKVGEAETFPDSELHGDGVEYYYQSKKDYINDKNSGYVKGFFDLGNLIKGEILNPSLTGYSEHKGINKIILEGKIRSIYDETIKGKINLNKGEIFYENCDHYKGEIDFDLPFGKGTMTLKDGSQKTCEWHNGNVKEN